MHSIMPIKPRDAAAGISIIFREEIAGCNLAKNKTEIAMHTFYWQLKVDF